MRVRGVVLPAFIFNLDHHLENLAVYADGLVDAWDLLDRPLFEAKVRAGVVTTAVPDGGTLSVHGLGRWVVQDGRWEHTDDALLARVDAAVRELNPNPNFPIQVGLLATEFPLDGFDGSKHFFRVLDARQISPPSQGGPPLLISRW